MKTKQLLACITLLILLATANAQTNTFPSSGNVGIGTLTPDYKLETVTNGQVAFRIRTKSSTVGAPQIDLYDDNRDVETVISSTDDFISGTYIGAYSNHPLMFGTNRSSAQVILKQNGNFGIGMTSPNYKLDVTTAGPVGFRVTTSNSSVGGPQVDLYDNATGQETVISSSDGTTIGTYIGAYSDHPLMFGTNRSTAQVILKTNGNLGIGVLEPTEKLSVNGNIKAKKIKVTQTDWPDYVFHPSYNLMPLSEVAQFIKDNNRLPDVPSAKEVEEKGISLGDNQALLLKKIEELTLYVIEMKQENISIKKEIEALKKRADK